MSTFEGKLLEEGMNFIRIDEFTPRNHDGTSFFLSHFHTDHFKGIFGDEFLKVLVENDQKMLYCSEITKNLILRKPACRIPHNKIHALEVGVPYILFHDDCESVQVQTIPAGHCPGSVMFLFEQGITRILYTGDFRIDARDIGKFKVLHDDTDAVKTIDTLYLDTTFCDPRWLAFPSRKQTSEDLTMLVTDWLKKDPSHEIGIWYNSYHGLENLLVDLAKSLKTIIWIIDTQTYMNYSCIPELDYTLCKDKGSSRIHLCPVREGGSCRECARNRLKTKTIKPCAMTFDQKQLELGRYKEEKNGVVRVAYSCHCSLEELIATVTYISAKTVYPCVLPSQVTSKEQVLQNLELDINKLKQVNEDKENVYKQSTDSPPVKRFCWDLEDEELSDTVERDEFGSLALSTEDKIETIILSSESEEEKPLSQSSLIFELSPPL